jgi:glycosyltransferase involved in cell wall biosynthesis
MTGGGRQNGGPAGARSVVLVHRLPWPPQSGADLRNWQNAEALARAGATGFLGLSRETDRPQCDGIVEWSVASDRPLDVLPDASAADMIKWLRDPMGHPSDNWHSPVAEAELCEMVARVEPDVVVIEHLWLQRYIPRLKELGCRVVLDAHNLEGPLHEEVASGRKDPMSAMFAKRAAAIEAAALEVVDQVWACSEDDARRIGELYPSAAPVVVVPNTIDVGRYARTGDSTAPTPTALLYPGVFEYLPNSLAATRLVDEIFPALARVRPDVRLTLVGSSPTARMEEAAARDPRIEVTGKVPDTLPYLHGAGAMPVPLHEGGGTRFKALEAFAAELPVVSTAKGVEGLGAVPGEHYLRAETTEEFVEALLALFDDERKREELTSRALTFVRERYSLSAARESVARALAGLGLESNGLK